MPRAAVPPFFTYKTLQPAICYTGGDIIVKSAEGRRSVEAGKFADMVILDANPLDDIRNVAKIYRTVKGGVVYEPGDPARPR